MITVGGHTFDETLLKDGCIIDIGCRDFEFANYLKDVFGKSVVCIDPDPKVFENNPYRSKFYCLNVAVSNKTGDAEYYENGEATCLKEVDTDQYHKFQPCKTMTIEDVYKITGEKVDILKMDCEGAEYLILSDDFRPIPKQISVEFHHHTVPKMHMDNITRIMLMLQKNYDVHGMEWKKMHGCDFNYWDVLFIRK